MTTRTTGLAVPDVTADDDPLGAALKYAANGWYVLPVSPASKHAGSALGKGWPAKSSRDQEQIIDWFAGTDHHVALHIGRSGAVAFDVDEPAEIPAVLAEAIAATGAPHQSTRTNVEGRGHHLFAVPEGRVLGNGTGQLGKTWGEVRGRNGIIIVAPSEHEKAATGGRYAWVRTGQLPVLPDSVAELLPDSGEAGDAATDAELAKFLNAHTGNERPALLAGVTAQFAAAVARGESRHEAALLATAGAMREALAGYYPATLAAGRMREAFITAMSRSRGGTERVRGPEWAGAEYLGILAWAIGQARTADPAETRRKVEERLPPRDDYASFEALIADPDPRPPVVPATPEPTSTAVPPQRTALEADDDGWVEPPVIRIDSEPLAIVALTDALCTGFVPDSYVRGGDLVQVVEMAGDAVTDQPHALRRAVVSVGADNLRRLLARHADVKRAKVTKSGTETIVAASPTVAICKAVLTETRWPGLPPLVGLVGSPVLRPDGTVLQDPGYDEATRLYYAPHVDLARVPEVPDVVDIDAARRFVLDLVLGDFPWAAAADRANFLALLMSPILRTYIGGLIPLGAISAAERGSGKTLLTDIIGGLYGATVRPWVGDDDELRKAITATLVSTNAVIVFDNVGDTDRVEAPSLAKLLTNAVWDDRLLGRSEEARLVNDRLWLVTGNNIAFGGDIAQRTVLVHLDPKGPRPDLRSGFRIPDLSEWLEDSANRASLLHALLVMARGWIVGGSERRDHAMRGFGRWAKSLGGFLAFHGVDGFLTNSAELESHDDEAVSWGAFLETWHRRYGTKPMSATELRKSAEPEFAGGMVDDPWEGAFITKANGSLPTAKGLGMLLASRLGRYFDDLVLRGRFDEHRKVWHYRVDRAETDPAGSGATEEAV